MKSVEAQLVYDPGSHPALIGRTSNPEALRVLKAILLEEAEARVVAMEAIDEPALAASEGAELARLRTALDALVPPNSDPREQAE